ncbi:MAG TPA: hypothetical protein ENJ29_00035 [Bacteroidetes bacterium]|nr:hypothetical protein [Bacteroidota bacterium]
MAFRLIPVLILTIGLVFGSQTLYHMLNTESISFRDWAMLFLSLVLVVRGGLQMLPGRGKS